MPPTPTPSAHPLQLETSFLPSSSSSPPSTAPLPSAVQTDIIAALYAHGSIPRIQAALTHELQASGWTQSLRARILELLRSGECVSYGEVVGRVVGEVLPQQVKGGAEGVMDGEGKEGANGYVNGDDVRNGDGGGNGRAGEVAGRSVAEGGVRVPESAIREGIRVVRKELEGCVEIVIDDE